MRKKQDIIIRRLKDLDKLDPSEFDEHATDQILEQLEKFEAEEKLADQKGA